MKKGEDIKKKSSPEVKVPVTEDDIKVIDMRLNELILGVVACMTLAGLGYTYYTYVKSKAEAKKMEAIAGVVFKGIEGITSALNKESAKRVSENIVTIAKTATKRKPGVAQA